MFKAMVKRSLARFGLHLVRNHQVNTLDAHLLDVFSALGINCILDVGGHAGNYGTELRRLGFAGHVVSFEPVAAHFAQLKQCGSRSQVDRVSTGTGRGRWLGRDQRPQRR